MPTAHDYRTAAARLRQLAQQVDDHASALLGCPVTNVFAGPVAGRVDEAIASVVVQLRMASDGLADVITVDGDRRGRRARGG